jgi:hypothetical protein
MNSAQPLTRGQWVGVVLGVVAVLSALVGWGGTARPGAGFVSGVGVFIALQTGFATFTYWLLFAPMPQSSPRVSRDAGGNALLRQLCAIGLLAGGFLFGFAATWDEAWHRAFGGFGRDFWWMPHLLLYGSFALVSVMAASSFVWTSLRHRGSLRERARAEPFITLMALIGGFLALSAPSDELWHRIYGLDLTAWSLPHTTVVFSYSALMLCGVCLALSSVGRETPRSWWAVRPGHLLALALLAAVSLQQLQFATTEWEGARDATNLSRALSLRPEWLYPVVIVSLGSLLGAFSSAALRLPGTATLVAVLTLGERTLMLGVFGGFQHGMTLRAYLLFAVVMIGADLWATWWQRDNTGFRWRFWLISSLIALAVVLGLMGTLMPYPRVNATTLPFMLGGGLVASGLVGWAGWRLGSAVAHLERHDVPRGARLGRATVAAIASALGLVIVAVTNAKPPV